MTTISSTVWRPAGAYNDLLAEVLPETRLGEAGPSCEDVNAVWGVEAVRELAEGGAHFAGGSERAPRYLAVLSWAMRSEEATDSAVLHVTTPSSNPASPTEPSHM